MRRVLWDYEPLRASHAEIFIDVEGQSVRLRGRVRSLPQKLIAGVLIERMADVGAVTNELIADPDVVRAVADALAQDERTAAYVLRVDARHGLVILRGEVPSEAVQQAAIDIAASVPIVNSVRNQLTIGGEALPACRAAGPTPLHGGARVTQTSPQPAQPAQTEQQRLSSRQKRIDEQRRKIESVRLEQRRRRMMWGAIIIVVVAIAIALVVLFFPRPVSGNMRQVVTETATHVDEGAPV